MTETSTALSPEDFQGATGASGEIIERLEIYLDLLKKWQKRFNLVGAASLKDAWRRHLLDCAQLVPLLPKGEPFVLDLGSGAGFPGVVLAMMSDAQVHMVESTGRKCVFIKEALRATKTTAEVHNQRIENLPKQSAQVITARGCAPLERLIEYAYPHLDHKGWCLFLKGRKVGLEISGSEKNWNMNVERIDSQSDSSGVILKLKGISRRHG
jgi:16S rRNA (guanine527-N7)-methyltransferase